MAFLVVCYHCVMSLVYITGVSGMGKSEVLRELATRGLNAHGVDEDGGWLFPAERYPEVVGIWAHHLERLGVFLLAHRRQPRVHPLGVAVFAAGRDLGAAHGRVPGLADGAGPPRPLDAGVAHAV